MNQIRSHQAGAITGSLIAIVLLSIAFVGAAAFGIWSFIQYDDYRTNFDSKLELAASEVKKEQAEIYAEKLIKERKEPNRQFVGPTDYGRVTFDYPKTWSVYEATDVSKGSGRYEAYLSPIVVPPVSSDQKYAIRVTIEEKNVDDVLGGYERDVESGELKTSSFSANDVAGTRIDGNFTKKIRGSAVVFKIRDKTLTVRTDSKTFQKDFDKLIKTIKFNQ